MAPTSSNCLAVEATERPAEPQNRTVLLAEDDASVRGLVSSVLRSRGFTVETASDGQQALELFQRHSNTIEMLITDLAMPRKNGVELIRDIRALVPELPIVAMSADFGPWEEELNGIVFLEKPFDLASLFAEIDRACQVKIGGSDIEALKPAAATCNRPRRPT